MLITRVPIDHDHHQWCPACLAMPASHTCELGSVTPTPDLNFEWGSRGRTRFRCLRVHVWQLRATAPILDLLPRNRFSRPQSICVRWSALTEDAFTSLWTGTRGLLSHTLFCNTSRDLWTSTRGSILELADSSSCGLELESWRTPGRWQHLESRRSQLVSAVYIYSVDVER